MAIDHSGSLALLYGRRYLALVNLDEPAETLKKVQRQSKYEVGTADWNPTTTQGQLFAFAVIFCLKIKLDDGIKIICIFRAIKELRFCDGQIVI